MRDIVSERGPKLPEADFSTIAVDLFLFSSQACEAVAAGEIMIARGDLHAPGVEHTIHELRIAARRAAQVRQFFIDMAPHEDLMRDFVAGLRVSSGEESLATAV